MKVLALAFLSLLAPDQEGGAGAGGGSPAPAGDGKGAAAPAPAGGGLVDAAAAAAKATGDSKGAGDGKGAATPAPAVYFPEGLDAKFKGANERETIDRLAKHLGELPRAPAKPEDYKFQPNDELAKLIDPKTDKVLPLWTKIAHKLGLTQPQYEGAIGELYGEMAAAGLLLPSIDVSAEFKKLGGISGDRETQIQKGQERILAVRDEINALATRQQITPAEAKALNGMASTADEIIAVEKLLGMLPKSGGPQNGGRGSDGLTDHERAMRSMYPSMSKVA